ncbi:molybdopterin-binding protein [Lichenihabitans psoromatis]|uniref:molybdopterin-binding protein n=1 Tax=Lichenihabitans psoromatis TaxID=2528642 RepID=UPI001FE1375A|nr:molybdopterin-binding protein [Lichenihabitans psoromatis]
MKFGPVPVAESVGAIAVHGIQHGGVVLKKGETIGVSAALALRHAGVEQVTVVRFEVGDVAENEAARMLAEAVAGPNVRIDRAFTGRANLFAEVAGILRVDAASVDCINGGDEAITLATLPAYRSVVPGEMIATVKIIPFAVPRLALEAALANCAARPIDVVPFRPMRVNVISTLLPGLKDSVVAKTLRVLERRLAPAGASIASDIRVAHESHTLAEALGRQGNADMTIVFGASAITDRRDVVPAGLIGAGGRIDHFGMPVDPGNLLLLGSLAGKPVLGAPGCARSPKENGFDWILNRLLAGLPVASSDIRKLGAGGLLMEIVSRPQPRSGDVAMPDQDDEDRG